MELLWVRHGEPERIETGTGVPADPRADRTRPRTGRRGSRTWLAGESIDAVLSSPQRRARETADPIARVHGLEVQITPGLVEYDVEVRQLHPDGGAEGAQRPAPHGDVRGPVGGVRRRAGRRVPRTGRRRGRRDRRARIAGQRVVAVCHGGVINVAFAIALGLDRHLWFEPHYSSLSRMIASRTGVRTVESINERAHLDGRGGSHGMRPIDDRARRTASPS